MRDVDNPTQCVTTYDEDSAEFLSPWEDNELDVFPYDVAECLTFFLVTDWGTVSGPTSVEVEIPAPDATPTVGPVTAVPDFGYATATATLPDDTYRLGIEVEAGQCPAEPAADAYWYDGFETGEQPNEFAFYPESFDVGASNCVMFTAIDDTWGQHGPVVMRPFEVPAPE